MGNNLDFGWSGGWERWNPKSLPLSIEIQFGSENFGGGEF